MVTEKKKKKKPVYSGNIIQLNVASLPSCQGLFFCVSPSMTTNEKLIRMIIHSIQLWGNHEYLFICISVIFVSHPVRITGKMWSCSFLPQILWWIITEGLAQKKKPWQFRREDQSFCLISVVAGAGRFGPKLIPPYIKAEYQYDIYFPFLLQSHVHLKSKPNMTHK